METNKQSDTLKTLGTISISVEKKELFEWLRLVFDLSGLNNLNAAIPVAKNSARNEDEKGKIATVANLFRAQCGGNLHPPISLMLIYEDLVETFRKEKR
ncbi:MAG: hypothetical protein IE916_00250 [Epsilonproteobacteria bacterium]|nr:hypothetical protein [Campylobacterota bacterium]